MEMSAQFYDPTSFTLEEPWDIWHCYKRKKSHSPIPEIESLPSIVKEQDKNCDYTDKFQLAQNGNQ
jgi:hypothetical protein